jgi:arylsulfate sulfotransferase
VSAAFARTGTAAEKALLAANQHGPAAVHPVADNAHANVTGVGTSTAISLSANPVNEGSSVSVMVKVSDKSGSSVPTGSVEMLLDGTAVISLPLVNGAAIYPVNTAGAPSGVYTIVAEYQGDSGHQGSNSAPLPLTIRGTTATTVSFNQPSYTIGQTATVTAKVTAPSGGVPTGSVQFAVGGVVAGSANLVNGMAILSGSTAGAPPGTYTVTASYLGGTLFQTSGGDASTMLKNAATTYSITPVDAALSPGTSKQFSISPAPGSAVTWYVDGIAGGNSTVGTISSTGSYTAPSTATALTAHISAKISAQPSVTPTPATAFVTLPGSVSANSNVLVASYIINVPAGASVKVNFGPTTSYGFNTWTVPAPANGGNVTVLVGGMKQQTLYHLQGVVSLSGGFTYTDSDRTFTTGALPSDLLASERNLTAKTTAGLTPQPGIELLDPVNGGTPKPYAIDLQGNVIWYYAWPDYPGSAYQIDGFKQVANGDYLAVIGAISNAPLNGPVNPATVFIREIDLAGNMVKQLSLAQLNTSLATAGYSLTLANFHHDIEPLPNGHWLVLANTLKTVNNTVILGDVVVDVDTNLKPVFVWNEFDYFDTNRRPMGFPDWTHSNAVVYSPTDGNFIVSSRHQSWIVKVNYQNGAGDGSILWTFGYQGSLTLKNGTSPIDWQFAQHYPSFVSSTTAGTFRLTMMDNGDGRLVPGGVCGGATTQPCYTTVPIFQIDEGARTATVEWRHTLPVSLYNNFGGNAEVLANTNVEYDLCGVVTGSEVDEVMQDSSQTLVWTLKDNGYQYRAYRIPSLYPGVQWP